jgi:uncharacterized protein (DUF1697 family)
MVAQRSGASECVIRRAQRMAEDRGTGLIAPLRRTRYSELMMYAALLRGVNVGGTGRIDMKELKVVFEAAGMTSVTTYINSGNVVFAAPPLGDASIAEVLEAAIEARFGLPVRMLVRNAEEIGSIVGAIPDDWVNDKQTKCDVFFLWDEIDRPTILEQLEYDPAVDDVRYTPGAVIRRVEAHNASRSRLTRIVKKPLYQQMTIRNCNTARAILKLMNE